VETTPVGPKKKREMGGGRIGRRAMKGTGSRGKSKPPGEPDKRTSGHIKRKQGVKELAGVTIDKYTGKWQGYKSGGHAKWRGKWGKNLKKSPETVMTGRKVLGWATKRKKKPIKPLKIKKVKKHSKGQGNVRMWVCYVGGETSRPEGKGPMSKGCVVRKKMWVNKPGDKKKRKTRCTRARIRIEGGATVNSKGRKAGDKVRRKGEELQKGIDVCAGGSTHYTWKKVLTPNVQSRQGRSGIGAKN